VAGRAGDVPAVRAGRGRANAPAASQLCVLAHRCEAKGLSLDARLLCYASALGRSWNSSLRHSSSSRQGRRL